MKKALLLGLGLTAVIIAALIGIGYGLHFHVENKVIACLKSDLNAETSHERFSFSLLGGYVEVTQAKLTPRRNESPWQKISIKRLSGKFTPWDIIGGRINLRLELDDAELVLNPASKITCRALSDYSHTGGDTKKSWPLVTVQEIILRNGSIQTPDGSLNAKQFNLSLKNNGKDIWDGTLECQSLILQSLQFGQGKAAFRKTGDQLEITSYSLTAGDGQITGTGNIPLQTPEQSTLHYKIQQVPIKVLLPTKWPITLNGVVNGMGDYTGPLFTWQQGTAHGSLQLDGTKVSGFPFMEKLTLLPPLQELLAASLDEAKANYHYNEGSFNFTEIVLTKVQKISLQGKLSVSVTNELDGTFKLGIPTGLLAVAPPLKEKIFTQENDGFSWTDLKISGTPEQIQEDLTPRLVTLSQSEGNKVQDAIKQGIEKANDRLNNWLKK
jgi:hypothetical protein